MEQINHLSKKDLGAILYSYYLENYCEDDFSFDNGKTRKEIEERYAELEKRFTSEELNELEKDIVCYAPEGTDYDSLEFSFRSIPELLLQVTSLIDYDGCRVDGYDRFSSFADVGIFFVDNDMCDFDDLNSICW